MTKAIIYDFDGTLTPDDLPKFEILEKAGLENGMYNPKFMQMSSVLAKQKGLEMFEAMILTILDIVHGAGIKTTRQNIALGADKRTYNPGVEEFMCTLQEKGVKNYILSSGAKDYLQQTMVVPYCESIYASTLEYNGEGEAVGTKIVMTISQKAKTLENIADEVNGNKYDCSGMFYIGDGPTDLYAMEFIKAHGGKNILVYRDVNGDNVAKMRKTGVVDHFVQADFCSGSELWQLVVG